ncbi:MAG: rhamnulokinase, partial [Phycisphaerae bacterium]
MPRFLAVDLGAESGRVVLGSLGSGRLRLEELARFRTGMVRLHGRLHWNVFRMLEELVQAFRS